VSSSTPDRLTITEPTAQLTALPLAEGGVALKVKDGAAYLERDDAIALMSWLAEATRDGLPPIQWERVPDETYDPATGYALLAGTQLPPVDVTPPTEEDES
jgi:hypothetical protein